VQQAARWYADNPIDARGEKLLQDPFDYAAEDQLVNAWRLLKAQMPADLFAVEPGYTGSYSGPGGSQRKAAW